MAVNVIGVNMFRRFFLIFTPLLALLFLTGCETNNVIISDVDEREANEIVVFLASKGIAAQKIQSATSAPGGGTATVRYSISVPPDKSTESMAILNQNGLPRRHGTNLLELFAKAGLMSTDKEETIRYQAGLASQIANTIRKIDGIIDADVQLSFPTEAAGALGAAPGTTPQQRVTASVYVKHSGILDDPNSHLVTKIKRLVSGSVNGLDINDVTVISDRSRFTDVTLAPSAEALTPKAKEYVSIWSIVMSKSSASRFRTLFFILIFVAIILAVILGWIIWKFYPILRKKGLKEMFNPVPVQKDENQGTPPSEG